NVSAKVRWRDDRQAWFLYVYANGTQVAERYGPTLADKRRAERQAKEVNELQRRGKLGLEKREEPGPFDGFPRRWIEEKVRLPVERGFDDALAPKTACLYEQLVRLHLIPSIGTTDVRAINSREVDALETHLVRIGKPPSRRSRELVLGVLRRILAHARA